MILLNQKKILKLVAINCRYSNKDVAKAIGVSEDVVRYQIDKLVNKEKMGELSAFFNFNKLGFSIHHYLIRFKDVEEKRLDLLKGIKEIFFLNKSTGKYDVQIIIAHRTDEELLKVKKKIDEVLEGNIDESILIKFYKNYKWTNLVPCLDVPMKIPTSKKNPIYKLNKEDWHNGEIISNKSVDFTEGEKKTIKELVKNPRGSYSEIGKKTKQSYETVRQQIYKFVEKGYIDNFGMMQNYSKYSLFASYFLINIKNIDSSSFATYVQSRKNIFYAAELIGKYNVILYLVSETPQDLHNEVFELRKFLKSQVLDLEMLSFNETLKSVQFPEALFE